jgi:nucleoside-diphosphate-sugar epimerase
VRALITGITGFVGPHLAEYLLTSHPECEVWGLAWGEAGRQQLEPLKPRLQLVEADLTKPRSILPAVRAARPDLVFHLAAASSVASSWTSPALFVEVNVIGQINLFEALRAEALDPVVVVSSSGDVYGQLAAELLPAREDLPLKPVSPYGLSKAGQDLCAYQYFAAHSLRTVRLRLFNHTGPRRPSGFVLSSFARQVAEIEAGRSAATVRVGNLDAVRDFLDVRDVARAYWLAARGRTERRTACARASA